MSVNEPDEFYIALKGKGHITLTREQLTVLRAKLGHILDMPYGKTVKVTETGPYVIKGSKSFFSIY